MTGIMSEALANSVLEAIFKNEALAYTNVYISLHTDDPGDNGANEVVAGGNTYGRRTSEPADWDDAASKEIESLSEFTWDDMPECIVKFVGVWTSDTVGSGTFLWGGALAENKSVPAGETFRIRIGDLKAKIDPPVT